MHQSYKVLSFYLESIGDLECSGACLSGKRKDDDLGTLVAQLLAPRLQLPPVVAPPTKLLLVPRVPLPLPPVILYECIDAYEYHGGT